MCEKGASYCVVQLICWIQKYIGFLLTVHNRVLVITAGFMGCENPLSLNYSWGIGEPSISQLFLGYRRTL